MSIQITWPVVPCQCGGEFVIHGCECGPEEKVLRYFMTPQCGHKMTPEQREWCYSEIDAVEAHDLKDYETGTDAELARGVLNAWQDYCRDKGLL